MADYNYDGCTRFLAGCSCLILAVAFVLAALFTIIHLLLEV